LLIVQHLSGPQEAEHLLHDQQRRPAPSANGTTVTPDRVVRVRCVTAAVKIASTRSPLPSSTRS
jgi:hypothetical protein